MASHELDEHLDKYLADAHAIEEQALAQMRAAPDVAGSPVLASAFADHLEETERHERLVRQRLEARGASPSRIKDFIMAVGGISGSRKMACRDLKELMTTMATGNSAMIV